MAPKYVVTMRYNGTSKQYFFTALKDAHQFMYKQEMKGCDPRNLTVCTYD